MKLGEEPKAGTYTIVHQMPGEIVPKGFPWHRTDVYRLPNHREIQPQPCVVGCVQIAGEIRGFFDRDPDMLRLFLDEGLCDIPKCQPRMFSWCSKDRINLPSPEENAALWNQIRDIEEPSEELLARITDLSGLVFQEIRNESVQVLEGLLQLLSNQGAYTRCFPQETHGFNPPDAFDTAVQEINEIRTGDLYIHENNGAFAKLLIPLNNLHSHLLALLLTYSHLPGEHYGDQLRVLVQEQNRLCSFLRGEIQRRKTPK